MKNECCWMYAYNADIADYLHYMHTIQHHFWKVMSYYGLPEPKILRFSLGLAFQQFYILNVCTRINKKTFLTFFFLGGESAIIHQCHQLKLEVWFWEVIWVYVTFSCQASTAIDKAVNQTITKMPENLEGYEDSDLFILQKHWHIEQLFVWTIGTMTSGWF